MWAQIDFINLMLPTSARNSCQGTLIVSTIFDQLARVSIEQFLLWSIGRETKVMAEKFILQGILMIRLVAGCIHVGFIRPEFAPACVPRSSLLPTSIVILALDIIIIGFLLLRACSLGMFSQLNDKQSHVKREQSQALILTVTGLTVWTGVC